MGRSFYPNVNYFVGRVQSGYFTRAGLDRFEEFYGPPVATRVISKPLDNFDTSVDMFIEISQLKEISNQRCNSEMISEIVAGNCLIDTFTYGVL
jgi:hypothetical protein